MSDTLLGLIGRDYVMIASDGAVARSIVVYKDNEDKILQLDQNKMMAAAGPSADRVHFCEYIEKNVHLYQLRTGITLTTHATANFTRQELASALRRNPYQVNLLVAGYDEVSTEDESLILHKNGAQLYFIDYLGAMHEVNVAAHGYASYFALSIFDRFYKKDMTLQEGCEVMKKVISELHQRFLLKVPDADKFSVKVADKNGIRTIKL